MADERMTLQGRIKRVSVNGFRSLGQVTDLELPQLSVLIGANGSGKSNLIRFFEMLSWMLRSNNLQGFILENGGADDQLYYGAQNTPRIDAQIQFETEAGFNEYRFALAHASPDTLIFTNETFRFSRRDMDGTGEWIQLPMPAKESQLAEHGADPDARSSKTAYIINRLLKSCAVYQFHDTSAKANLNLRWDQEDAARLRSDGGNLAPVLLRLQDEHPKRYKVITHQIRRVLPVFEDFVLEPVAGKIQLRWRSPGASKTFGPHLTSDGSLRLFCLFTLLNLPGEMLPDILMIDEPELGLHPHAIALTAEMIKSLSSHRQIFIATQSPLMVDAFEVENIIVARLNEGSTTLQPMDREQYRIWLEADYLPSDLWLKEPVG